MIFTKSKLDGAYIIEPEKIEDERGFFARTWDNEIFEEKGLNSKLVQCSISFNKTRGTIRGMHYQEAPYEEAKLVSCPRGKIFDIIIDLRTKSKTFKKWDSVELSSENYKMIYIPEGFAHGFQTLEDNSVIQYQISQVYAPEYYRGIRWDDPTFKIQWPLPPTVISKKDSSLGYFKR